MARGSLRRYDVQAKVSLWVSCAAVLGMLVLVYLLFLKGNYSRELRAIVFGAKSMYGPAVFLVTAGTLVLAAVGAALGANSAGQRRNTTPQRSWAAFFISAATMSLTIILFAVFWFFRMRVA